jgi:hypothetical protein
MLDAFVREFNDIQKSAGLRGIGDLLTSKAVRKGLDPSKIPGIQQVTNIAVSGNRGRAAEVGKNISGFLSRSV